MIEPEANEITAAFNECACLADGVAGNAEEAAAREVYERNQITRCLRRPPLAAMRRAHSWREIARKFRVCAKLWTLTTKEGG